MAPSIAELKTAVDVVVDNVANLKLANKAAVEEAKVDKVCSCLLNY